MGVHVNPGLHSISSSQQSSSLNPHFSFLVFGSKLIYIGKEIKHLLDIQLTWNRVKNLPFETWLERGFMHLPGPYGLGINGVQVNPGLQILLVTHLALPQQSSFSDPHLSFFFFGSILNCKEEMLGS